MAEKKSRVGKAVTYKEFKKQTMPADEAYASGRPVAKMKAGAAKNRGPQSRIVEARKMPIIEAGTAPGRKVALKRLEKMLNKLSKSKERVKAAKDRKPIVSQAELDSMIARAQVEAKVPGLAKHKAATPGPTKVGNVSTDPNMLMRMKTDKGMAGVTGKRHSLSKKQVDEGTSAARSLDTLPPHVRNDLIRPKAKKAQRATPAEPPPSRLTPAQRKAASEKWKKLNQKHANKRSE